MLDLFTVVSSHSRAKLPAGVDSGVDLSSLTLTLLGDLKHGRTVHSLAKLAARLERPPKIHLIAPDALQMPEAIVSEMKSQGVSVQMGDSLEAAMPEADVLYVTRVQKERFATPEAYEAVKGLYVVDAAGMLAAKKDMIVLHPLPRVDEIATDVDADPRAKYFEQMENGMYVRMALLALVLGADLSQL